MCVNFFTAYQTPIVIVTVVVLLWAAWIIMRNIRKLEEEAWAKLIAVQQREKSELKRRRSD
ncbi:hypothetical protein EDC01DRAFT_785570 [Geopyxis carbonaria]|nr:hypothetical protein EDC01DRAFT_785570 [Geopyxis carbonaria]